MAPPHLCGCLVRSSRQRRRGQRYRAGGNTGGPAVPGGGEEASVAAELSWPPPPARAQPLFVESASRDGIHPRRRLGGDETQADSRAVALRRGPRPRLAPQRARSRDDSASFPLSRADPQSKASLRSPGHHAFVVERWRDAGRPADSTSSTCVLGLRRSRQRFCWGVTVPPSRVAAGPRQNSGVGVGSDASRCLRFLRRRTSRTLTAKRCTSLAPHRAGWRT